MIGKIVHWAARVSSVMMIAFFLMFFIGNGGFCIWKFTVQEAILMGSMLAMVYGLAEGWNNEKLGGIITISGFVVFYLAEYYFSGNWANGPWFAVMASPAVLYLLSWRLNR